MPRGRKGSWWRGKLSSRIERSNRLIVRERCNCIIDSGRIGGKGILLDNSSLEVSVYAGFGNSRRANICASMSEYKLDPYGVITYR
jgi:hypothetical protein